MQKLPPLLLLLLLPLPLLGQDKPGAIEGTIRFIGPVPAPERIMTTDGGTILHNELVVDPKTKGLRFVAVYLEKAPDHRIPARKGKTIIDQRDMLFLPRVIAIQEGQSVVFENNDLCNHGVRASSVVMANTFNVNTPPGQPFTTEFKAQKHPILIDCPIHAWMKAHVYAFDHPFFAVTDEKGTFHIANVPPGKHTIVFHHADTGLRATRPVMIEPGRTASIQLDWEKTPPRK